MGYSSEAMAPYNRGFDATLYHQLGYIDPYTHQVCRPWTNRFDIFYPQSDELTTERNNLNPVGTSWWCALDFTDEIGEPVEDETTFSELLYTQKIIDFIKENKDEKIYIHYATDVPHFPLETPPANDLNGDAIDYSACDGVDDTAKIQVNLGGNNGPQPEKYPNRQMFCQLLV